MKPALAQTDSARPARGHDSLSVALGLIALLLLASSPWLVDRSGPEPFYKGPLIFPMIALGVCCLAAVPAALRAWRDGPGLRVDDQGFPRRGALLIGLMSLFPVAIAFIGMQAASLLTLGLGLRLVGVSSGRAITISILISLCLHLAFRTFLDIWFPQPWLADILSGG